MKLQPDCLPSEYAIVSKLRSREQQRHNRRCEHGGEAGAGMQVRVTHFWPWQRLPVLQEITHAADLVYRALARSHERDG